MQYLDALVEVRDVSADIRAGSTPLGVPHTDQQHRGRRERCTMNVVIRPQPGFVAGFDHAEGRSGRVAADCQRGEIERRAPLAARLGEEEFTMDQDLDVVKADTELG